MRYYDDLESNEDDIEDVEDVEENIDLSNYTPRIESDNTTDLDQLFSVSNRTRPNRTRPSRRHPISIEQPIIDTSPSNTQSNHIDTRTILLDTPRPNFYNLYERYLGVSNGSFVIRSTDNTEDPTINSENNNDNI